MYISCTVVALTIQLVLLPSHLTHCTNPLLDLAQRSYVSVPSAVTGRFGVTCLRLVLVSSALTVQPFIFSSFLVVARRHYRYTGQVARCRVVQQEDNQQSIAAETHVVLPQMRKMPQWHPESNTTMCPSRSLADRRAENLGPDFLVWRGSRRAGKSEEEGTVTHR